MTPISAMVITRNEARHISACLETLHFCDEIVVVDSQSEDNTVLLAKGFTDKVYTKPFENFSAQKNFAISKTNHDWILSVDADERVSTELAKEIKDVLEYKNSAFSVPRINYLFGRKMRYGANHHDHPIRLFHKKYAEFEGIIHEQLKVKGKVGALTQPLLHYSTPSINEYMRKLNQYTDLEAERLYQLGKKVSYWDVSFRPLSRFFQRYVLQWGVLDGMPGFFFSTLSAFYDFVKYVKLWELHEVKTKSSADFRNTS